MGAQVVAVLTGDIVDSTALGHEGLALARQSLMSAARAFGDVHADALLLPAEFFRGDAWQLALRRPELGLRLALFLTARLRSEGDVRTRIAIGLGAAEGLTPSVATSVGEGFQLSGRALDAMTGYYVLTADLPEASGALRDWVRLCVQLCGRFAQTWTRRQAEIVAMALLTTPPHHAAIADKLVPKVAKQTVTKALEGAHWHWLQDAVATFEAMDWRAIDYSQVAYIP
jgi:hypothetical protein